MILITVIILHILNTFYPLLRVAISLKVSNRGSSIGKAFTIDGILHPIEVIKLNK